jgi:hypothetical protein
LILLDLQLMLEALIFQGVSYADAHSVHEAAKTVRTIELPLGSVNK